MAPVTYAEDVLLTDGLRQSAHAELVAFGVRQHGLPESEWMTSPLRRVNVRWSSTPSRPRWGAPGG
jgi:hypothetical protein